MPFEKNKTPFKSRRYVHRPFTVDHDGIKVSCNDKGMVTITQPFNETNPMNGSIEHGIDEVEIPAQLIYTIANMLKASVKVIYKEKEQ